jgi:CHAD domain-containing protein
VTAQLKEQTLVGESAILLARAQLAKAIDLLDSSASASTDQVVHQVRKRIKKVRALIKLVWDSVGKKVVAKVDRRLRESSRPLSEVRDASALLVALDRLEQRSVGLVPIERFQAARVRLEDQKAEITHHILDQGKALAQARKTLRSARRRMAHWEPDEPRSRPISGLGRAFRRGRAAFRTAQEDPSVEKLHELRKRVKALGYQLKVLGDDPSNPTVRVRLLSGLLADELGEGHDLDLLREFLEGQEAFDPILKALDRRRIDLRQGALQRAGVIFQTRPKQFVRSLKSRPCPVADA